MFTGGDDPTYRAALASTHAPLIRVDVYQGNTRVIEGLPVITGQVTATLGSRTARRMDLTVPGEFYPDDPDGTLNPYAQSLRAYRGIRLADGNEFIFPVFRGRIQEVELTPDGACAVMAEDRGTDIDDAAFPAPESSVVGANVLGEFKRLVASGVADATFGPCDPYGETMPQLSWEQDRGAALDEIATSVGSYWYTLAGGEYVMRRVPWSVLADPVVTWAAGGHLLRWAPKRSRGLVYNSVTGTGERLDSSAPVFATVADDNPNSPTFAGGPFGLRSLQLRLQTPQTEATIRAAARSYLQRTMARTETWAVQIAPDAAVELGDAALIVARGREVIQVVRSYTMPMTVGPLMTVQTRARVVGLADAE